MKTKQYNTIGIIACIIVAIIMILFYIFLMGGESRTISIKVRDEDCQGKPVIKVEGFNHKK